MRIAAGSLGTTIAVAALGPACLLSLLSCQVCPCQARGARPPQAGGAGAAAAAQTAAGSASTTVTSVPYAWKSVTILGGGFVSGVIFSPIEKDLVYARTDVGGAYRWNPADKSWIPLNDGATRDSNFLGIESLAPDPVDANLVYLAVGTYTASWAGNGAILRSKDRGNTWERTDMPIKMGGNEYGRSNGERLAVDPNDPKILFFGSRKDGLWKSADAGVTFAKVDGFPVATDPNGIGIVFVLFDRASGSKGKATPTLYAGVAKNEGALYRSTDAGASWKLVPKQPTGVMASHAELDSAGTMYLSYGNGPGPGDETTGAVWKYDPKKETFTNITPVAPAGEDKFGYGGLSVYPARPGTLMVTTIDRWTKGDEIFRTIDGGKTWKALGQKAVRDDAGAKYLYWGRDKPSANGWMGDIAIDPFNSKHAFYVTGQGIWATEDADLAESDKPTHWVFQDKNLEETVVADLVSPPSGPPLLSAVGDICGFRHDDLGKPSPKGMFDNPICGSGSAIDFAENKPDVVARVHSGEVGKRGAYSLDGGNTWKPFTGDPKGSHEGGGTIAVSADGAIFVWSAKETRIAFSRDRGASWTTSVGVPEPGKVPGWAPVPLRVASDRVNPQKFYVYDALGGKGYTSTDGGAHFAESSSWLPTLHDYELTTAWAKAVPKHEGHLWLSTGKELYRSTDSGKTYESVPSVTASYGVGFGMPAPGKDYPAIYLIGKVDDATGFFRSDDQGANWARINDDQHQYGFTSVITGDPRVYGRAYVGTGGRGIVYGEPKR